MLPSPKQFPAALLLAAPLLLASTVSAQRPIVMPEVPLVTSSSVDRLTRFDINVSGLVADPRGDFRENVGTGWGLGGNVRYRFDRKGIFSLRADLLGAQYGRETKRVPLSSTVGGRILVDLTTSNEIGSLGIGPQLTVPSGPVRPYVNGAISVLSLSTSSSVKGSNSYDQDFASTTNYSDNTSAWVGGGGILIPFGQRRWEGFVDIGARYNHGGEASYLREGSISDNSDGSISYTPLRSRTPFVVYTIGFSFNARSTSANCPAWICF